jgi:hypothetical protein
MSAKARIVRDFMMILSVVKTSERIEEETSHHRTDVQLLVRGMYIKT